MLLRIAAPVLGPNVLAAGRIALATVTLAIIMLVMKQRWPWRHWRELAALGALSVAVPFLLFAWALIRIPAGYGALLNSTAVVFGTLASAWLKEDTLTARKLMGCALGFVGVALIVRLGPVDPTPEVLLAALACMTAAACYGWATPLMKRATRRMDPLAIAAGIHLISLLMLLPGAAWSLPQARFTTGALLTMLVLGVVTSGLAYWIHLRLIRHVSPVAAISPAFMIPIFGVTWGHVFLDEDLGSGIWAGGALILLATMLVTGFNPFQRWFGREAAKS